MNKIPLKVHLKRFGIKVVNKLALKYSFQYVRRLSKEANPRKYSQANTKNAIVIQGPLLNKGHVECIKAMSSRYKKEYLILSTWEGTDNKLLDDIRPYVDFILKSNPPQNPGLANVNMQITSTYRGIEHAIKMGAERIMKTRVDTVVGKKNLFEYFEKMCGGGYFHNSVNLWGLNKRLLIFGSSKSVMYAIADFFMIGEAEDMEKYWSVDNLDERLSLPEDDYSMTLSKVVNKKLAPEAFLGCRFAEHIGWELKYTYEDYVNFLKEIFCIINSEDIRWFWLKRPWNLAINRKRCIGSYMFTQYDWLNMLLGNDLDISFLHANATIRAYTSYDI